MPLPPRSAYHHSAAQGRPPYLSHLLSLFAFLLLGKGTALHAQNPDLRTSIDQQEWRVARQTLAQLYSNRPQELPALANEIEYLLLEVPLLQKGPAVGKAQTDTLLKVYETAIQANPLQAPQWKARRALMAMRFAEHYPMEALSYVKDAVEAAPRTCPLHLYSLWMAEAAKRYGAGQYPLKRFCLDWEYLDRMLYLRSITQPSEAEDCHRITRQISHRMLSQLPNCDMLIANYRDAIHATRPESDALKSFMAAYLLGHCDAPQLFDAAAKTALKISPQDPNIARLLAREAMQRQATDTALTYWDWAIKWEKAPDARAGDLLFQSELLALKQDFRGARAKLEAAMALQPSWGEPYIRLADLYLDGANTCAWSGFDRKALNWLLIDLCQKAREVDPTYEAEAIRRLFEYQREAPTTDELKLRGLNAGDTWPLRCWMSTATTVKVF